MEGNISGSYRIIKRAHCDRRFFTSADVCVYLLTAGLQKKLVFVKLLNNATSYAVNTIIIWNYGNSCDIRHWMIRKAMSTGNREAHYTSLCHQPVAPRTYFESSDINYWCLVWFLGVQKATICFVISIRLSFRLPIWNNSAPTRRIFIKFDI
jgi:hypothetical protein